MHALHAYTTYTTTTTYTTYTAVAMHRMCELPRMGTGTKSSILGVPATGLVKKKGVQKGNDERGYPFALSEVKPLNLVQCILEHHHVTHVVEFAAGSAAMAIAAAVVMNYEGIAANDEHCNWLDSIMDKCVMYMAGKDKQLTKNPGVCYEVTEKVAKYFGGRS